MATDRIKSLKDKKREQEESLLSYKVEDWHVSKKKSGSGYFLTSVSTDFGTERKPDDNAAMPLLPSSSSASEEPPLMASVTDDYDEQQHQRHASSCSLLPSRSTTPTMLQDEVQTDNMNNNNGPASLSSSSCFWPITSVPNAMNNMNIQLQKEAFLSRYETMLQRQDAEDLATRNYLKPCFQRLEQIICGLTGRRQRQQQLSKTWRNDAVIWQKTFSFAELRLALTHLQQEMEQRQLDGITTTEEGLTTDSQLMLVLDSILLLQAFNANGGDDEHNDISRRPRKNFVITWAEIVQCYKTCIAGMQTLKHLPAPSLARDRTRDRTMAMMSLFDEHSTREISFQSHSYRQEQQSRALLMLLENQQQTLDRARKEVPSLPPKNRMLQWTLMTAALVASGAVGVWLQPFIVQREIPFAAILNLTAAVRNKDLPNFSSTLSNPPYASIQKKKADSNPVPSRTRFSTASVGNSNKLSMNKSHPVASGNVGPSTTTAVSVTQTTLPVALPTLIGAIVVGPVAAALAGSAASAVAVAPAVVFGAGLVSLGSLAIYSFRMIFLQGLMRMRGHKEEREILTIWEE